MHISKALDILSDGQAHQLRWIKMDGSIAEMRKAKMLSYTPRQRRMNVKSIESGQIRKLYFVQLIELDSEEIFF